MRVLVLILVGAVTVAGAGSRGANAEEASPSYVLQEAIVRYKMADYEKAVELLQQTIAAEPEASIKTRALIYKGMSLQILGKKAEAEVAFTSALTVTPLYALDAKATKPSIVALFDEIRARLGHEVAIKADRPAKVFVNGKIVGTTPLQRKFSLGKYQLRLETDDNLYRAETEIEVTPQSERELTVSLTAHSGRLTITSTPSGALVRSQGKILGRTPLSEYLLPAGEVTLMLELADHQPQPLSVSVIALEKTARHLDLKRIFVANANKVVPRKQKPRLYTWIALGAAGAAAVVGMGFGISAHQARSDYANAAKDGQIDAYYALADQQQDRAQAANISWITAGGLAAIAVVLFFVEGTFTETPATKPGDVSLGPSSLGWQGRF